MQLSTLHGDLGVLKRRKESSVINLIKQEPVQNSPSVQSSPLREHEEFEEEHETSFKEISHIK